MFGVHRIVIAAVALAGVATAYSVVDRSRRSIARSDSHPGTQKMGAAPVDPPGVREAERSRRAQRPEGGAKRTNGLNYDAVVVGLNSDGSNAARKGARPKPAEPMPRTACRSVEPAPKSNDSFKGPHRVHQQTTMMFESASGFGFARMAVYENDRGIHVPSRAVDRVELVSLLTDYDASVYVLDEMATPALAKHAKRRPLDEFERLGLEAVRRGENLVWTRDAPTRMFGAIRAKKDCLECHANAKEGDLLGAFTYYLTTPVDQLATKGGSE